MNQIQQTYNDDIDLIKAFYVISKGKWKVAAITLIIFLGTFIYLQIQPPLIFNATTKIKSVTNAEIEKYQSFNQFLQKSDDGYWNNYTINAPYLKKLYIEQLNNTKIFEEAINESNLINRTNFNDSESYESSIKALASGISLHRIRKDETSEDQLNEHEIKFTHSNEEGWKKVLLSVDAKVNENIRIYLLYRLETAIKIQKQKKDYAIDDLELRLQNELTDFNYETTRKINNLELRMRNALTDYDRETTRRLAFLKEQAEIARTLGISKSTLETQMFSSQSGQILTVGTDIPFYLKGYEAIEKEIELISAREDKKLFVESFMSIENQLRDLKHIKESQKIGKKIFIESFMKIEDQIRSLNQNKTVQRIEDISKTIPIMDMKSFKAVELKVETTKFAYSSMRQTILLLAAVLGLIIGVFYVIVSNSFREHEKRLVDF